MLKIPAFAKRQNVSTNIKKTEQTTHIDVGQSKILNLDAGDQVYFIAFTDDKTVVTNNLNLKIKGDLHFPIIRRIDNDTFLLLFFLCLAGMPYDFYPFVRLAGLIGFAVLAFQTNEHGRQMDCLGFGPHSKDKHFQWFFLFSYAIRYNQKI